MSTYGATITRATRVVDGDVAKGMKPWERKKALEVIRRREGLKFQPPVKKGPIEPSARLREQGKDVEKGVGVAPVLARRIPAAGRGGRKVLTGDQVNVRRVIGKSEPVSKLGLTPFKALGSAVKQPKALLGGLKSGYGAGRAGLKFNSSPASAGARLGQNIGQVAGANPVKTGAAAGAVGMGLLGPRRRDQMYAPSYAAPSPFGKRSFDPEGDRRYRQGAAAAAGGIGGATLLHSGVKDVRRETKRIKGAPVMTRRVVPPELSPNDPRGKPRSERSLSSRASEIRNAKQHNATAAIADNMRNLRGVVITRRGGAKLAGATGLLGLSGALVRNRHEERWD